MDSDQQKFGLLSGLGVTRERSIAAAVAGSHNTLAVPQVQKTHSLERNPSVLSRKELIKQEYNLLLETRLPNIMQLMNSEKSLGLGLNINEKGIGGIDKRDLPDLTKPKNRSLSREQQ